MTLQYPEMIHARGDGVSIQVAQWPGEGGPVLAVHGLTANSRCFDTYARALSPPHRFLALDLRGRGLSDKPASGYSLEHHVQDIAAVLADLGIAKTALLGHSLGAYIGLAFADAHPDLVDKLVLLDGGGQLSAEQWGKVTTAIKPSLDRLGKVFPSFEAYLEAIKQAPYVHPVNQAVEDYFRYECEEVPAGGVRSRTKPEHIAEERKSLLTSDTSLYYAGIKCPVLVLRATEGMLSHDDLVLPPDAVERLKKDLPGAEVVDLKGLNHFNMIFAPSAERDQALREFLAG